ncbi:hypothetical protein [Georgenia sp. SUBG003]|uniref:hypothetical protein n=1 Tax=Georgenia sp. SUBG003 TaxID=1497974 RepID=UPI003AB8437B
MLYEQKVGEEWVRYDATWTLARVEELAKGLIAAGVARSRSWSCGTRTARTSAGCGS